MIPFFVTLIPVFFIVRQLGWIDTYQGLVVPGLTSAYGIFLMRQFIITLPDELIDAARIDGASELRIFGASSCPWSNRRWRPWAHSAFIGAWNNFLWPLLVLNSRELMTLPLGINSMKSLYADNTNLLMAGTAVAVIPMLDRLHLLAALLHPGHRSHRLERIKPPCSSDLIKAKTKVICWISGIRHYASRPHQREPLPDAGLARSQLPPRLCPGRGRRRARGRLHPLPDVRQVPYFLQGMDPAAKPGSRLSASIRITAGAASARRSSKPSSTSCAPRAVRSLTSRLMCPTTLCPASTSSAYPDTIRFLQRAHRFRDAVSRHQHGQRPDGLPHPG